MRQLIALVRGLAHRAGSAAMILVVAIVAAGTAAAGPVYYQSARISILRDALAGRQLLSRGYQATLTGPVSGTLATMRSSLSTELSRDIGAAHVARLFRPQVASIEGTGVDQPLASRTFPLVWRTGFCAHLVIHGSCPAAAGQVIVSSSDARIAGWTPAARSSSPAGPH